jgi:L-fuconate dehydratase
VNSNTLGDASLARTFRHLWPYIWPLERADLRMRIFLAVVLLLAAKFEVPVCPHAGGLGLCEYAQHLSMFDFVAVGGSRDGRDCEFVDHLHEHFEDPVAIRRGRYLAPTQPGYGIAIRELARIAHRYPDGTAWA